MDSSSVFQYKGGDLEISEAMKRRYNEDGFIIIKNLASSQELAILEESIKGPLSNYAFGHEDTEGGSARLILWNTAGRDSTGLWSRSKRMVNIATQLLGGEVYHYHSKLILKDAKTGGKFMWHQDYGYWYDFDCHFPDMLTVFVALDRCGTDNGCLEVLKGSHRCGRLNHSMHGEDGQMGANVRRVADLEKHMARIKVELQPGDALVFHCNLLHTSSANTSEHRRWALLTAFNKVSNKPNIQNIHGLYEPLEVVDDDTVVKTGVNTDLQGKTFLVKVNGKYKVMSP